MSHAIVIAVLLTIMVVAIYIVTRLKRRHQPARLSDVLRAGCIKVKIASPR